MIITSKQDNHHDRLDSPDDWVAWEIASDHVGRQGRLGEVDFGTIYRYAKHHPEKSTASHRMIITSKQDNHHDRLDSPDDWVAREAA